MIHQPLTLPCGQRLKNRFFKSAMSEGMANKHHEPTEQLINIYKRWAEGGTSVVVTGNVMISKEALGEPGNVVLNETSDLKPFKQWATEGSKHQTQLWMQINHPGRQAPKSVVKQPLAPSAVSLKRKFGGLFKRPIALKEHEIQMIIQQFITTAKLAKAAGFSGVQIHAAHGYLISQFLSPKINQRHDHYGGSLDNRMRLLIEIYQGMRKQLGTDYPIAMKLNIADFIEGGFSKNESLYVMEKMADLGIDLIELSGGNYENPIMTEKKSKPQESYFLQDAKAIQNRLSIPIAVTGGFRSKEHMNEALKTQKTSLIGLARPLVLYPDLTNRFLNNKLKVVQTHHLTTGIKSLDRLFGPLMSIGYYQQQMRRLSQAKPPKLKRFGGGVLIRVFLKHFHAYLIRIIFR